MTRDLLTSMQLTVRVLVTSTFEFSDESIDLAFVSKFRITLFLFRLLLFRCGGFVLGSFLALSLLFVFERNASSRSSDTKRCELLGEKEIVLAERLAVLIFELGVEIAGRLVQGSILFLFFVDKLNFDRPLRLRGQ